MNVLSPRAARVHGVATVLAPLLLLASSLAYVLLGGGINNGVWGGILGVWCAFAFVIAFAGIGRVLEPAAPRAAPVVTAVALVGWATGIGFQTNAMYTALRGDDLLFDASEGENAVILLAFLPWGWFAPLGFVLLGWLLWRTGLGTRWQAALLVLGGVLFLVGYPGQIAAAALASNAAVVLALVPLGYAILTGTLGAVDRPSGRPSTQVAG